LNYIFSIDDWNRWNDLTNTTLPYLT
jgi:hypothetical protein